MKASWYPEEKVLKNSNIYQMMLENNIDNYIDFWKWSVREKEAFWAQTLDKLHICFHRKYNKLLDVTAGVEHASWLKGAQLNIADSCFQQSDTSPALIYQHASGQINTVCQGALKAYVNRIANGLVASGLKKGDRIAIDMPMTLEAVAIYLAGIKAGCPVVTIADSFSPNEIAVRLNITKPKLLFTQDAVKRANKYLPLYKKVLEAAPPKTVVVTEVADSKSEQTSSLRSGDLFFSDFLSKNEQFESVKQGPEDIMTILFSSGTTGAPKAIPWTHTVPVKCASDGFYHHNIQAGDVVCWPTNLGWMMGPWLIFASLINKATIALFYDAPMGAEFGAFVEKAQVTMLGLVPSIVRQWKNTGDMEAFDWSAIKCFSSTGEASNPSEMEYLMQLANNKPVIEYCGGTEIGGGYVTSTMVQPNIPSTFSTQALGGEFILLDEQNRPSNKGEMFLIPPILGLSETLLNRDHHEVYYQGNPSYKGQVLRRHGDELIQLDNGYYKARGRSDDAMNLGGIKVSSIQIEAVINQLDFVKESAAIAVSPPEGGPGALVIYAVTLSTELHQDEKLKQAQVLIRKQLNPLFKISQWHEIDKLPRTASGKVMRRSLRTK